jgi:hypothetical protein
MKVIPLSEAKANLSRYGRMYPDESVIVTIIGVPSFQLAPLDEGGDLIDRMLAENPEFRRLLEQRSRDRTVSLDEARKRL